MILTVKGQRLMVLAASPAISLLCHLDDSMAHIDASQRRIHEEDSTSCTREYREYPPAPSPVNICEENKKTNKQKMLWSHSL